MLDPAAARVCVAARNLLKMNPRKASGQKQIEMKTRRENDIRTSGDPGDYIEKSFTVKGREGNRAKPGRRGAPRRPHHT